MKKLTKIKLINWHYFNNETIKIKNNTLLTGQNGTGKSTILDAITFVLTGGDQDFNLAATDKGKRDLRGYVKCKLGSTEREYLRDYDLSGHICLEFYSEKQQKYFTCGVVIDIYGEFQPPKLLFYVGNEEIDDKAFIDENNTVHNTMNFKKAHPDYEYYTTKKEAKSAFRLAYGGVNSKYFDLIPKAIAFKPIEDVKDYIYKHLLEEKQIDVANIQESIRSYKEFEVILKQIKLKIADLKDLHAAYDGMSKNKDQQLFYEYLIKVIDLEVKKKEIKDKEKEVSGTKINLDLSKKKIKDLDIKIEELTERSQELYSTLLNDDQFTASRLFDSQIQKTTTELEEKKAELKDYLTKVTDFTNLVKELESIDPVLYKRLSKLNLYNLDEKSIQNAKLELEGARNEVKARIVELHKELSNLEAAKEQTVTKVNEIVASLNALKNNSIPYNPVLVALKKQMEQSLRQMYGYDISVHVLAELIEVKDPAWANTVEDLLGNQRFALIVEPRYFDDALEIYHQLKSNKIFGINLVNTKKIQNFTSYQANSLASIIETENKDARCYINYSIGNLIMCDDVKDLDKHNQAITIDGMLYRGYVVRALDSNTPKPFIGRKAKDLQMKKWNEAGMKARSEYLNIEETIKHTDRFVKLLDELNMDELLNLMNINIDVAELNKTLSDLNGKKKHISASKDLESLRRDYELMRNEIRTLNDAKSSAYQELGSLNTNLTNLENAILEIENQIKTINEELEVIDHNNIEIHTQVYDTFNARLKESSDLDRIQNEYRKLIEEELKSIKMIEDSLNRLQIAYVTKYNLPYPTGYEHMHYFLNEEEKLEKSELIKYESKVRELREQSEKIFKEDFLSKLRNHIMTAQDEIGKINQTLKKIKFGGDTYEFVFPKSKEFSSFYEMVIDEQNVIPGYGVFNEEFEKKYQSELEELFDNLAQDETNSHGIINKYTDYRTYMDYDLKVTSKDGDVFMFSNINKLKSGGETQIPFYVAILASFVRLFDQATISGLDDSIGLIIFDEVFDKMDQVRTKAMMTFINNLNVQILLATPPQKMESLSEFTDTTIITLRNNQKASVYEKINK